jgi:PAS domain S-box-containing protein
MRRKKPNRNHLRSRAEEALKSAGDSFIQCPVEDVRKLIHELQVHQVELAVQNEELRRAQAELEESCSRYADLYDFTPVGYLTFDRQGLIVEANLTAADQLGTERATLLKKPFSLFLLENDRELFRLHLAEVLKTGKRQTCEVKLNHRNPEGFFARLDSIFIEDASGKGPLRTSMSDISSSKHAEEVLKRSHRELEDLVAERSTELSTANEQLRREVDLRDESLRFERLISDSSARFVSIGSDQIDPEIESALEHVREFFRVDRCALLGLSPDLKRVHVTHAAYSEGTEHVPGDIELASLFPWSYGRLVLQRQPVRIDRLEQLPERVGEDKSTCIAMGIRSFLTIPIIFEGRVSSIFALNAVHRERDWSEHYIPRLRLLGEIFINALERRKADLVLRESEARLSLAADAAGAMLWDLDMGSGQIWTTQKAWDFFGFPSDRDISLESFLGMVHPEDRENLRESVKATMHSGSDNSAEYRIVLPGGSTRWILSKGRQYKATPGSAARLIGVSIDITERKQMEELLQHRLREIEDLRDRLEAESAYLQEEIRLEHNFKNIIGKSDPIKYLFYRVQQVSNTDMTVLILGETGTGKELIARSIHENSPCRARPMVKVNCAVLPAALIESELFGHEKGAFTGAVARKLGRFEIAGNTTLFLDEIGELPFDLQAKLLRVIEEGEFERLGGTQTIKVSARIIAATNRNLEEEMKAGHFRADLWYRLNVYPITVPPLRERTADIPLLVAFFLEKYSKQLGKTIEKIPSGLLETLKNYMWPGNIRELQHVIERAVINSKGTTLQLADDLIGEATPNAPTLAGDKTLEEMERDYVLAVLGKTGWKIEGRLGAAQILNLHPNTLRSRMKKLGIQKAQAHGGYFH